MAAQENRDQAPKKYLGKQLFGKTIFGQQSEFSVSQQLGVLTASAELSMLGGKGSGFDILYRVNAGV